MKTEYINPFILASFSVLEMVLGNRPVKGQVTMQPTAFPSQGCNVVFGVTGDVHGTVIFGMSQATADQIASTMMGQQIETFDHIAASALGELGNMVCGNASQNLHDAGIVSDITPPTIVSGSNAHLNLLNTSAIVLPLTLEQGEILLTIGLQGRK